MRAVYTVRDFLLKEDGQPVPNERALVEVTYPGEDGLLIVDPLDEVTRDPVKGVSSPAVSVALNRWRQILLLEHHFTERSRYYQTAHRDWPKIARHHLTRLGRVGQSFIPDVRERVSVNDVWQVRALLGSEVDYSVLLFAHQALGEPVVKGERALRKRREAIIQHVCTHAPCLMRAQLPVTTLPISPAMEMHLRYTEALTIGERIVAGLAAVQRADEWEEVEPGRRVAYMRFVPDPRKEPRVNKVAMVCEFLKSQEGAAILTRRRPFREMRTAFDHWRFRVDNRTLEKRRERRRHCYTRFSIGGSPMYTFLLNPSTLQVIDPLFCFPDLIVEYSHPA